MLMPRLLPQIGPAHTAFTTVSVSGFASLLELGLPLRLQPEPFLEILSRLSKDDASWAGKNILEAVFSTSVCFPAS